MRVVFAGGGKFALPVMELLAQTHDIVLATTPPPKPAGRKMTLTPCPAAKRARELNLQVLETADKNKLAAAVIDKKPDAIVVADYGVLLPPAVLNASPRGALNIHPSLLPRWRGAAPIARAILAGDKETGICIMQMDEGIDTGAILLCERLPLPEDKNCGELTEHLAQLGAKLMLRALKENPAPTPQSAGGITYAKKLTRAEGIINYDNPAQQAARQIRAFAPARTIINGAQINIHKGAAKPHNGNGANGEITNADATGITIKCARGALILTEIQRAGKSRMSLSDFLRGFPIKAGMRAEGAIK